MPFYENEGPDGYYIASSENVLEKIRWIKPYVDRLKIWFSEDPHYDIDLLESLCGNVEETPRGRKKAEFAGIWCDYKLDLSQPTRAAFDYLIENTRPPIRYFPNNVEMSLDFTDRH